MNLQALKELKEKLDQKKNKDADAPSIIFKPVPGDQVIRVVPLKSNPDNPFQVLKWHYKIGGKSYLSPLSYNQPDPLAEWADFLISEGTKNNTRMSKEDFKSAVRTKPIPRTYLPIVVRGKEEEGVKFWAFGKETYEALLTLLTTDGIGDVTDVIAGRDLKISFTPAKEATAGSAPSFAKTTVALASLAQTPLHSDKNVVQKLLSEQPNLLDAYPKHTYDELKEVLAKYIDPSTPSASSVGTITNPTPDTSTTITGTAPVVVGNDGWAAEAPKAPTPAAPPAGTKTESEFDDLFNK